MVPVGNADLPPACGLVGLRPSEAGDETVIGELQVRPVERDKLAAPERAGETKQDERPVTRTGQVVRQRLHHLSDVADERRLLPRRRFALLPEDAAPDATDALVRQRVRLAG